MAAGSDPARVAESIVFDLTHYGAAEVAASGEAAVAAMSAAVVSARSALLRRGYELGAMPRTERTPGKPRANGGERRVGGELGVGRGNGPGFRGAGTAPCRSTLENPAKRAPAPPAQRRPGSRAPSRARARLLKPADRTRRARWWS